MSKFQIKSRLDLSSLGEGWQGCYLDFTPFGVAQLEKLDAMPTGEGNEVASIQAMLELVRENFITGVGFNGTATEAVLAEDLVDLPISVLKQSVEVLTGQVSPNSPAPSTI